MEYSKPAPIALGAKDGRNLSIAGGTYRILVSGKQTGGAFATIEMNVPPGSGPGPHAHPDFEESFYVLEGEVEVKSEASTYLASKGAFVNIPKGGIIHCFKNKSDKPAKLLCTVTPAGLEDMFEEIGTPVTFGQVAPSSPPGPEALENMKVIAEKYGQTLYPPDYLDK